MFMKNSLVKRLGSAIDCGWTYIIGETVCLFYSPTVMKCLISDLQSSESHFFHYLLYAITSRHISHPIMSTFLHN